MLPALAADVADREQYGEAKVACEHACLDAVGDRLLIARAGLIAGYGDVSDRFGYWPARFAAAADGLADWARSPAVLAPDAADLPTQIIDVHDLARWLVQSPRQGLVGTFNALGERYTLGAVLDAARSAAGYEGQVELVPSGWLLAQGVTEFMGPRSLPLWLVDEEWRGFSAHDGSAARAAGLACRPLGDLVRDSLRWERQCGLGRARRAGLSPDEELDLLTARGR